MSRLIAIGLVAGISACSTIGPEDATTRHARGTGSVAVSNLQQSDVPDTMLSAGQSDVPDTLLTKQ